jgi:hypothetical protein
MTPRDKEEQVRTTGSRDEDMHARDRHVTATWRVDVVILSCAISAGIHGALAPEHFEEGVGTGLGFIVAAVLVAALAVRLTMRPDDRSGLAATALVLLGLIAGYALAITTGLPLLHQEAEPVEGLALVTKAVEIFGVAAASSLLWRRSTRAYAQPQPEGAS